MIVDSSVGVGVGQTIAPFAVVAAFHSSLLPLFLINMAPLQFNDLNLDVKKKLIDFVRSHLEPNKQH